MNEGQHDNIVLKGDNPFGVDRNHYQQLATIRPEMPDFSETHFWSAWNPEAGVGFFIHVGTDTVDKTLWWAQVLVYLPNGMAVVDRSWGRSPDRSGPTTGNFSARCVDPLRRWHLKFDGAGEIVSGEDMASRLVGAGAALPMQFDVELTATMPVWDLFKAVNIGEREWGGTHHEQVLTCKGWLRVGGKDYGGEWRLDGMSFRDHSIGGRDFSRLGGDHLFGVYFPQTKRSLQTLIMWDINGKVEIRAASLHQGDELELINDVEMSGVEIGQDKPTSMTDAMGNPKSFKMMFNTRKGRVVLDGEVLHTVNISLIGTNTNVNGAAMDHPGNPLILAECQVRMTWPDGEVGYGHLERTYRVSLLPDSAK